MLLEGLFAAGIRTSESMIAGQGAALHPEEAAAVAGAVANRRHEFSAGRACARNAMERLGLPALALPMGSDRAPVWPQGLVGTISHDRTHCAAAVALRSDGFLALGLDIEEAEPVEERLADDICTAGERDWLARQPAGHRGLLLKAIFSAKECAYKCQYPLSGTLLDFQDLSLDLDMAGERFTAQFLKDALPFGCGDRLAGRIRLSHGHIVSAMSIRDDGKDRAAPV